MEPLLKEVIREGKLIKELPNVDDVRKRVLDQIKNIDDL
jgi:hypothetical protein